MISGSDFNLTAFDSLESQKKRLCLLSNTAGIGDWSYIFKTDITIWSEYLSVSYTHLDVYKRQVLNLAFLLSMTIMQSAMHSDW